MKIELHEIKLRDVFDGYKDDAEAGVKGYGGKLNIRPAYQREFVYGTEKRNKVIETVRRGFPLNVMYWVKNGENDYELLDGQQRTISSCQYCNGDFSILIEDADGKKRPKGFENLTQSEKDDILDYKLMIYICEGDDKEKLTWFQTINIAGEKLTDQELNNAIYTGTWLTDAKQYFSKTGCPAYRIADKYLNGSTIRQDYLETALRWISSKDSKEITDYMREHQNDSDALELWTYFQNVISWVKAKFKVYRKEMKGIEWGFIYNKFDDKARNSFDPEKIEAELKKYFGYEYEDQITNKKGIFEYVLDHDERHLNIRAFKESEKRAAYEKQNGICAKCGKHFEYDEMEGDHITPWSQGGKTELSNLQMLCKDCNRRKSDR